MSTEESLDLSELDYMVYVNLGLGVLAVILAIVLIRASCRRWRKQVGNRVAAMPEAAKAYVVNEAPVTTDQNATTQLSHIRNETNSAIMTLEDVSAVSGRSFDTPLESPLGTPNYHRNEAARISSRPILNDIVLKRQLNM